MFGLDHLQYDEIILEIICDKTRCKELSNNANNILNQLVYDKIYPIGSAPAKICGVLEMRKFTPSDLFPKFRSIVSSIGAYNCQLPKYLCDLFSPHLARNHCPGDSFRFFEEIKSVSLDNTSKELADSLLLDKEPNLKISKNDLKRLFEFAHCETHFMFKKIFYNQSK